jgi:hypothetical protein
MLATISVIRKAPVTSGTAPKPVYDQDTQTWTTTGVTTVLSGVKARIQPYGIIGDTVVGQDTTGRRLMRVQIENVETGIHLDDIVIVTNCPDDPELLAYTLEVRGAISSSNAWLTDLVVEADLKANT